MDKYHRVIRVMSTACTSTLLPGQLPYLIIEFVYGIILLERATVLRVEECVASGIRAERSREHK